MIPMSLQYIMVEMSRFGMEDFDPVNAKQVEEIQQEAGNACMYESFMEVNLQFACIKLSWG